ncbi:hypothetical protein [Streptomyces sp. NPDC005385]
MSNSAYGSAVGGQGGLAAHPGERSVADVDEGPLGFDLPPAAPA